MASSDRIATAQPEIQTKGTTTAGHWEALSDGPDGMVSALAVFDAANPAESNPILFAGGRFTLAGGQVAKGIAKWENGRWSAVDGGIDGSVVEALIVFDEDGASPTRPALFAGGDFKNAGNVRASNVARWNGTEWSAVGDGIDGLVLDMAVFDEDHDGPAPQALFAAGIFDRAGGQPASNIARWDGHAWSAVGTGWAQQPYALIVADPDSDGPAPSGLVVGCMKSVDLWDGTKWYSFGNPGFRTLALATLDHEGDGRPTLYAAGQVMQKNGGAATTIASWNGTEWVHLPDALDERVYALAAFDPDADGPLAATLYVAGSFTKVGDRTAHGLALWDGKEWSVLDGGPRSDPLTPRMNCLTVFDPDGLGARFPRLCVGGLFALNSEAKSRNVATWSFLPPPQGGIN